MSGNMESLLPLEHTPSILHDTHFTDVHFLGLRKLELYPGDTLSCALSPTQALLVLVMRIFEPMEKLLNIFL